MIDLNTLYILEDPGSARHCLLRYNISQQCLSQPQFLALWDEFAGVVGFGRLRL